MTASPDSPITETEWTDIRTALLFASSLHAVGGDEETADRLEAIHEKLAHLRQKTADPDAR